MIQLIRAFFLLSVGSWFSLVAAQQTASQHSVALAVETIRSSDFGLDDQIASAVELVGPDTGPAGRKRAVLTHRLQCWIDGIARCSFSDLNDPRVRAIRRFLALGPSDRGATITVQFRDQSRIDVRLVRASGSDVDAWAKKPYEPVVLPDTARAPELSAVPARAELLNSLAFPEQP